MLRKNISRKIIHVDMDCYYAAIEMRDFPSIADKPVAVGGDSPRSVVCTANYAAREYGVHSAMPMVTAKRKCPHLVIMPTRGDVYKETSLLIRSIFKEYSDLIEPLSLDEAYLDVSDHEKYATQIAKEIRFKIYDRTQLRASAGIASNKMLAKIASDWKKPNGQFTITDEQVEDFMKDLPIKKIFGVGKVTAEKLKSMGFQTCGQIQKLSQSDLFHYFGKWGFDLFHLCRGLDNREVNPNRIRKSLSTERTFLEDIESFDACWKAFLSIYEEFKEDLKKSGEGRAIGKLFVKVKFSNFQKTTKECVGKQIDLAVYKELFYEAFSRYSESVRLIGVGVRFAEKEEVSRSQLEFDLEALYQPR